MTTAVPDIRIKRVYDTPDKEDGERVLAYQRRPPGSAGVAVEV
jgi:uncharacterized protein YeaO (DUF488 family)